MKASGKFSKNICTKSQNRGEIILSDYILTYSKIKFFPLKPVKEDIKIEDIAHSLSLMTRANGHCSHFYSVGQHSNSLL